MSDEAIAGPRSTDAPAGAEPASATPGLDWLWVAIGVVLGTVLVATLVSVVEHEPPRPDVAILIGGLSFVLTGVLLGYQSPGETVGEAAVAGGIVGVMGALVLTMGFGFEIGLGTLAIGWVGAFGLSTLGGAVGEILQGTIQAESDSEPGISWPWVLVGTVLGVVLNGYSIFVVNALFHPPALVLLGGFAVSFVLAGLFVGYASPGVTILEPALAALLMVAVDAVLIVLIFNAPFPLFWIIGGGIFGFVLALAGGAAGEGLQAFVERRRAEAPAT